VSSAEPTFPLVLRRRLIGLAYGAMHSARRGVGSDVAGSRAYRPGDNVDAIDWAASARLSSARGSDEFVVRERYAEEAPRVVLVCDRRPAMGLYPPGLPWLSKRAAAAVAASLIAESAVSARGLVGYLDYANGESEPFWRPPAAKSELYAVKERHVRWPRFDAPEDNVTAALGWLQQLRGAITPGSLVFVLSDFLVPQDEEAWERALERRWDLVPVVIQDPTWEASFPDLGGVTVPVLDPASGRARLVRVSRREARRRRAEHEARHARLVAWFRTLGTEPVLVESSDPADVFERFLDWSAERAWERRRGA